MVIFHSYVNVYQRVSYVDMQMACKTKMFGGYNMI